MYSSFLYIYIYNQVQITFSSTIVIVTIDFVHDNINASTSDLIYPALTDALL